MGPPPDRPTGVRFLVLGLACGVSFVLYLQRYAWGFVKKDVQAEFGWDNQTVGWLDGLFALSYGLSQVPAGAACDWFGARTLLGGSILAWSIALAGVAIATGVWSMASARLAFGVAQAGGYPALNKVSKNWFPRTLRPVAQGLIATFFGRSGGAAAFLLFGLLLGVGLTWREAVIVFAAAGLAWGVLFLVLFRNTPREHPWANAAEAALVVAGDPQAAVAERSRLYWPALLARGTVWFLLARALLSNMADVLYVYWVPLYLREEKGLGGGSAGLLAALPLIGGAVGGLASGAMLTRLVGRHPRWGRAGVAMAGKTAAGLVMLASLALGHPVAVAAAFLVVKFFTDMEQPAEWGAVSDLAGPNAATVFGFVNMVGGIGGFLASPLIGRVLDAYSIDGRPTSAGWEAVFVLIAGFYLLAAACWPFIDARRPLSPRPAS